MNDDGSRWYFVEGINPTPWMAAEGSIGRNGGKAFIRFHSPKALTAFEEAFAEEFKIQNPDYEMMTGKLEITFYICRAVEGYEGDDGRKGNANYADSTNMLKALEDSLQGILYENDRNNVDVRLRQVMQSPHAEPMVLIHVRPDSGLPTDILRYMYERQAEVKTRPSNILPKERGADGVF